jgi:hypothetical protein
VVARDGCTDPGPQQEPNGGGDSGPTAPVDETPPAFDGVTDTEDAGFCQVLVHWDETTAVDDCSGIGFFTVYRDNGVVHAGTTLVGTSPGSPYMDTTPGNGVWVYVARAVNGAELEEQNEVFVQESESSCMNEFPRDAGMKKGKNIDPPNADKQGKVKGAGSSKDRLGPWVGARNRRGAHLDLVGGVGGRRWTVPGDLLRAAGRAAGAGRGSLRLPAGGSGGLRDRGERVPDADAGGRGVVLLWDLCGPTP